MGRNARDEKAHLRPSTNDNLPIPEHFRMATAAMFFEKRHQTSSAHDGIFTLKPYDWELNGIHYQSMYLMFMQYNSEYSAAMGILGSWPHWLKLCECSWFKPELEKWKAEMDLRDEALAKDKLVKLTKADNITAAKALLAETKNPTRKVGRPSKKTKGEAAPTGSPRSSDLDDLLNNAGRARD